MKQYDASTALWDQVFSECEPVDLEGEKLEVEPTFDTCLALFAKESKRVLDFGCGTGDILFQCADFGYLTYGMGIDRSHTGIEFARQMTNLNLYHHLDFVSGDDRDLVQMEDGDYDGIILSNVLDVVPDDVASAILKETTRILAPGGLMFIKLNPYEEDSKLSEYGLTCFSDNLYEEDGVLRLRNLSTEEWKKQFLENFILERYLEFPYPWQEGMNRLFLLRKK